MRNSCLKPVLVLAVCPLRPETPVAAGVAVEQEAPVDAIPVIWIPMADGKGFAERIWRAVIPRDFR